MLRRGLVCGGRKPCVASATASAFGQNEAISKDREIMKYFSRFRIVNDSANRSCKLN